jgi:glycosyltransferase involved in cell wall biosynthesis
MVKVLYTTPILEFPALGGPQLRIANSIIALNKICDLRVLSRHRTSPNSEARLFDFMRLNSQDFVRLSPQPRKSESIKLFDVAHRLSRKIYDPRISQQALAIANYSKKHDISIIWFGYGNISYSLIKQVRRLLPAARIICDTDSVWSRFITRRIPYVPLWQKPYYMLFGRLIQHREFALSKVSDLITAVSDIDLDVYQSIASKESKVMRFSNVVNAKMYEAKSSAAIHVKESSIYLAGTFGHKYSPMDYGCRWFLENVMPMVENEVPNVHFYIAGNQSRERFADYEGKNVTVLGRLDDLTPYLRAMDVSIVPLFFESGTRYKILEAAMCGVPVVSTSLGAEGLGLSHDKHLLIADSAQDFSRSVIRFLNDSKIRARLSSECQQKVSDNFLVQNLKLEGMSILNYLSGDNLSPR